MSKECPRFLINLEKVGEGDPLTRLLGFGSPLDFDPETNARDVFWKGNCDDGCQLLADKLGWGVSISLKCLRNYFCCICNLCMNCI